MHILCFHKIFKNKNKSELKLFVKHKYKIGEQVLYRGVFVSSGSYEKRFLGDDLSASLGYFIKERSQYYIQMVN